MATREEELAALIEEQAKDIARGRHVEHEIGTISLTSMEPFLSNQGLRPMPRARRRDPECHIHGRENITAADNWVGWRCRVCYAERTKAWYAKHPEKRREHVRRYRATEKGREAHNRDNRAYYWRKKQREQEQRGGDA